MISLHWTIEVFLIWVVQLKRTLLVCLEYCNTCFIRCFLAWSGKLGDVRVSSGILSATFFYWLLLPKEVVLSPFFVLFPLQIACLHSEPAYLLHSQTAPNQRNEVFARLVSQISSLLRASHKEDVRLHGAGWGMEKVLLPGGVGHLGQHTQRCAQSIPSWVSTKMQTQWNPSCRDHTNLFVPFSCFQCGFFEVYALLLYNSVESQSSTRGHIGLENKFHLSQYW